MKAILCALDFSEASENVIQEAFKLASDKKTNLIVLFTYRLLQRKGEGLAEYRNGIEAKAKADFEALLLSIEEKADVPFEFITEIGFLADRIESFIKRNKVEAVVLCQRLADTMNEQQEQSLETLITSLKIPVIIIPEVHEVE